MTLGLFCIQFMSSLIILCFVSLRYLNSVFAILRFPPLKITKSIEQVLDNEYRRRASKGWTRATMEEGPFHLPPLPPLISIINICRVLYSLQEAVDPKA